MTGNLDGGGDASAPRANGSQDPFPPMSPPPPQWTFAPPGTVDRATGRPLSDKSKTTAGLLQLFPGLILVGGLGRIYAGQIVLGVVQLVCSMIGWGVLCISEVLVPLVMIPVALWAWLVLDSLKILLGHPVDGHGRLLRS